MKLTNNPYSPKFESDTLVEVELDGPFIGDLKRLKIWVRHFKTKYVLDSNLNFYYKQSMMVDHQKMAGSSIQ